MRALAIAGAIALTLVAGTAVADDTTVPSRQDVHEARVAARDKARDVATVQADLVLANQRLQQSGIRAAQAAESYNGARWQLHQARAAARAAERRSALAQADVQRQRDTYADAISTSYQLAPGLTALSAIAESDGISTVLDRAATMQNAESAIDGRYDAFRASSTVADVATGQARDARAQAAKLEEQAAQARDAARSAQASAASEAQAIAVQKDALIAELARLQHTSVALAQQRQSALEAAAARAAQEAAAAQAAQEAAQQQAQQAAAAAAAQAAQQQSQQAAPAQSSSSHGNGAASDQSDPAPEQPAPAPNPPEQPAPAPPDNPAPANPAPASGARAAIGFARAQLGEPYRWGAAGPDAWDCSGLTLGAWRAGGRSLPHYSVAQYQQSTPISAGSLQPGDLVFWGSSSNPGSIYHVALYAGGGRIIHAPRTGRPVTEDSMYYWIPPNFYARP